MYNTSSSTHKKMPFDHRNNGTGLSDKLLPRLRMKEHLSIDQSITRGLAIFYEKNIALTNLIPRHRASQSLNRDRSLFYLTYLLIVAKEAHFAN
jgi:hypothetical protein